MANTHVPPSPTADREIRAERLLNAPRELVWQLWTDPDHMEMWWGPSGFSITTESADIRPGGHWTHIMHGPDGTDYPNHMVYLELVEPEKIVYANIHEGVEHHRVTITFDSVGDQTYMRLVMVLPSAAARLEVIAKFGALEGMYQHLDRLSARLAELQS